MLIAPTIWVGSSPLARGLRRRDVLRTNRLRIIPARAGFTAPTRPARSGRSDHPRSRGVYPGPICSRSLTSGSSPLARGLRNQMSLKLRHRGIIPARAGFTARLDQAAPRRRDHPRSRGVYCTCANVADAKSGSSPLARGLRTSSPRCHRRAGIIPARAGFTGGSVGSHLLFPDHPRSRGVY